MSKLPLSLLAIALQADPERRVDGVHPSSFNGCLGRQSELGLSREGGNLYGKPSGSVGTCGRELKLENGLRRMETYT
ncbi:hypothetical protein H4582DRAFT_1926269 [Lactarius indigo]|nr:hypothetical protein H4582DRAFT_2018751 [Lactarius indigo]KAI9443623.1 hypothetical protein H4582DRAFT_1926269 [Lactarius indigo]